MLYVTSDFHGQYDLYMKLIKEIRPDDTLYVLGDVIDRGPASIPIIQDMMGRENVIPFMGNHEFMMLDYIRESGMPENWFYGGNGGRRTYEEFLKLSPGEQDEILDYLDNSWVQKYIEVDGIPYALSHSFFLPDRRGEDLRYSEMDSWEQVFKAVWFSPYRMWERADIKDYDDGYVHIVGHIPVQVRGVEKPPYYDPELGEKLLTIDGGCNLIARGRFGGLFCMSLGKEYREFWFPGERLI